MSRGSAALACPRFRKTHNFDKIAKLLYSVMSEHGSSYRKVVSTVTENALNMVKCFEEFGVHVSNNYTDENDYGESDEDGDSMTFLWKSSQ